MTRRDEVHQGPPAAGQKLRGFPNLRIRHGTKVYRAHEKGPWYFASAPQPGHEHKGGRFDLAAPKGTLYVANNPLSALAERLGPALLDASPPELDADAFAGWFVSGIRLPYDYRAANLWSQRVGGFGVIASEMSSSAAYAVTQAWAAAWKQSGLDGVRYSPRHDPHRRAYSLALFGHGGDASADHRKWPTVHAVPAQTLLGDFSKVFNVQVLGIPSKAEVPFVHGGRPPIAGGSKKVVSHSEAVADPAGQPGRVRNLAHTLAMKTRVRVFRYRKW
ncbi:RES domain-containing protein [Streptomyces sp. SID1328]|nr:RES domain-containing protein [Streptomyces sp. SID1328]